VFLEVLTTYAGINPQDFSDFRRADSGDESFHANLPRVTDWIETRLNQNLEQSFAPMLPVSEVVRNMIHLAPTKRPAAQQILTILARTKFFTDSDMFKCCAESPEPYVVYEQ
jgi:hypothetical protein